MTQEEKQLLLRDLCARLQYGVKIHCNDGVNEEDDKLWSINTFWGAEINAKYSIECVKPYLRPMSSITEEEKNELLRIVVGRKAAKYFQVLSDGSIDNTDARHQDLDKFSIHYVNFNGINTSSYLGWLNAHHFDYCGLIKKCLALEAPKNMYNAKKQ